MSDERLIHLEARFAWLERHVLEQDKAMAEMGDELRRCHRDIEMLRERLRTAETGNEAPDADRPPPHY
jgi:SlyX protein